MFALVLERDPLKLEMLPEAVRAWITAAGGFAAVAIAFFLIIRLFRGRESSRAEPVSWPTRILSIVIGGMLVCMLPTALVWLWNVLGWNDPAAIPTSRAAPTTGQLFVQLFKFRILDLAAACAIVAALVPMIANLGRLRWRRIWALAKLSFKEAIRRRVLWGFSALLLVFLFASWFLPYKPEDQVRNYVRVVYWAMSPLLLVTATLLAAFSIPADLSNQTIHTIVTKPVQRFEILLGRFIGYTMLMTLVLAVMTTLSLVYVARGPEEEAKEESYKARVPVYGELDVRNGKNVGYEWDYRQYITGAVSEEEAIWTFYRLPQHLADRDTVRCEFTFDVFRTTKGEENKGVYSTFVFENWQGAGSKAGSPDRLNEYRRERDQIMSHPDTQLLARAQEEHWSEEKRLAVLNNSLAEKYGIYELPSKEVVDFHTLAVEVPGGLFKSLPEWNAQKGPKPPPLRVVVRCDSATQYLGVAKSDLYLLDAERGFAQNFFKGAVGLWFRLCLVTGLAVTCSTYLSGVIGFLTTMFLYLAGLLVDFIRTVAEGKALGGGPLESLIRLTSRSHPVVPLDQSPVVTVLEKADKVFEWLLRCFLYMIPDVDRFDLTDYVAQGFNISGMQLFLTGLLLAAYLLPWAILGFYLMRSREVAA